jgi:hypothetical protein
MTLLLGLLNLPTISLRSVRHCVLGNLCKRYAFQFVKRDGLPYDRP